jgi:hypothetical protein
MEQAESVIQISPDASHVRCILDLQSAFLLERLGLQHFGLQLRQPQRLFQARNFGDSLRPLGADRVQGPRLMGDHPNTHNHPA